MQYCYLSIKFLESHHLRLFSAGNHGNGSFCLGEEEELEIEVQDDFLSFEADLVAEQLTYMDAVSGVEARWQSEMRGRGKGHVVSSC